jgi:hypothetical protein
MVWAMPVSCARLANLRMAYTFHRVFCATPGDLEGEREAFYTVMAEFNEAESMPHGLLLVAVSITPNMAQLPPYWKAIEENIQDSRYYIQVLGDTWGPPFRNFEPMYKTAGACLEKPELPMRVVAVLFKSLPPDQPLEPAVEKLKSELSNPIEFSDVESFRRAVRALLSNWLTSLLEEGRGGAAHAG